MPEESKKYLEVVRTVGDLGVEEFFSTLLALLDKRKTQGDPKLIEMSVNEFLHLMLEKMKTRAYTTAQVEASVAERVLTDWQAMRDVGAVTQPYRIKSEEDAKKLGEDMAQFYSSGGRGDMLVAIATCSPEGGYSKYGMEDK